MTGYVVDASIVVKWIVKEEWSDEASSLLEAEATLIAPELLFAEVCNALWAMRRRGDFGGEDLADATDARFHEKVRSHPYLSDRITHVATLG